jgi:adenylate kinase family enzyme
MRQYGGMDERRARVHILGAAGSGATTLGRALAEQIGCVHLDNDTYFWLPSDPPFQQIREQRERQALLGADLKRHDSWVLSGSVSGWGDVFIPLFDLVVFLWVPPAARLARLEARERHLFGEEALAPGGRMYETNQKFMAWAAAYDTGDASMRSRQRHEPWLKRLPCPVLRLEGEGTVAEHLAEIERTLGRS